VVGNVRRLLSDGEWAPTQVATGWGEGFIDELVAAGIELRRG
jgi:hypothetical protein